jgi:hypothetical protein
MSVNIFRRTTAIVVAALVGSTFATGLANASTVGSGYDTSNGTGTLGPAAPGDSITRAQIISRAQDWMNNQVPYSQTEGWEDSAAGGPYRMDCSGFVSMAWGLSSSLVTQTLPSVSTVTDGNISGDTNINPGDALDYTADHVVLFDHWTDSSGDFAYDAEHTYGQVTNQSTDNIYDSTLEGYAMSDFEALQYNHLAPSNSNDESNESTVVAPNGHMYKFARGTDGTLRMWSSDFTTGWVDQGANFGGDIVGSPAAVIAPNGHMYVFAEGTDHTLRMWSSDFTTGWIDNDAVVAGGSWTVVLRTR